MDNNKLGLDFIKKASQPDLEFRELINNQSKEEPQHAPVTPSSP